MLKIIDFIKSNENWREILSNAPYHLTISDDDDFTILKYSQIDSDMNIDIVRECRGLIIDKDYHPVCIPFFKFANYGESYADKIDWNTAVVEEKIDGSLIKVWNYKGRWIVSTNGTIFAENANLGEKENNKNNDGYSNFAQLFHAAIIKYELSLDTLNPCYTYMFELCSQYNRVVTPFSEIKLFHIGTRNNDTLKELEIDIGIPKPQTFNCNSLSDLIEVASKLKYCDEGYVVKDSAYHRIKVKSPSYVAAHHLVSNMNDRKLLELIRRNETDEFLVYFPEYKSFVENLTAKIVKFIDYIDMTIAMEFARVSFETRKEFATVAIKTTYPAFFFSWYDEKVATASEWLWSFSNEKIEELLGRLDEQN